MYYNIVCVQTTRRYVSPFVYIVVVVRCAAIARVRRHTILILTFSAHYAKKDSTHEHARVHRSLRRCGFDDCIIYAIRFVLSVLAFILSTKSSLKCICSQLRTSRPENERAELTGTRTWTRDKHFLYF